MQNCENLLQIADIIEDGGPHNPDDTLGTVEDLVDALVERGNSPEVFAFHDDHLGLKERLSKDFLQCALNDIDEEHFAEEIDAVLEQANTIISIANRELTENDIDDIDEDLRAMGIRTSL